MVGEERPLISYHWPMPPTLLDELVIHLWQSACMRLKENKICKIQLKLKIAQWNKWYCRVVMLWNIFGPNLA